MWRSITSRSNLTKHLQRKLFSLQNPQSFSSKSQVFNQNCFNSSSYCTDLLIRTKPRIFSYQSLRLLSNSSSISEIESENHEPNSSSSENEVDDDLVDVNDAKDIDGNVENNDALDVECSKDLNFSQDFDGNVENNDATNEELVEGDSDETIDVEKLEKVLSLLRDSVDKSLETSLDDLELRLNEEFVLRVIETPLVPGEHLIRFSQWASSNEKFDVVTTKVFSSLARVVCAKPNKKDAYALWDLVREVGGKNGVVRAELLNQLIDLFSKMGKAKAAFEVFGKFDDLGCIPNVDTYYLTIQALCKRSFYDWAVSVSQKMLDAGMIPDRKKVGEIISWYCKGLQYKEAHNVYLAAKKKNNNPSPRAVNLLISCLSRVYETVPLGKEMLDDISCKSRKHAINPFTWVIRGLCRIKDFEGGKKLLREMIEKGPPPGNDVFNIIINALSKAGDLEDAEAILKLMESRGLKPDVFSYSVIISGYAKEGFMEEACKVLAEARKKHSKLCSVTFHTLIRGYCKLERYDKAVELISDMQKYGVEPNVHEYKKLIQTLCYKALDWETSEKLLEEMKSKGMQLPGITQALINAVKQLDQEAGEPEEDVAQD